MLDKNNLPKHIAIIMDGNGRWAKRQGLPRLAGHREGIKRVREIIKAAAELDIKIITLFAFSTENWNRSKTEVKMLMRFFSKFLDTEVVNLNKNNVRFRFMGRQEPLARDLLNKISNAERQTANNTGLTVIVAFNYGGQAEIVDAAVALVKSVKLGSYKIDQLNEEIFSRFLYVPDVPAPDLLIRTSGALRISNFLLWQLAYSELYFTKDYWPDFTKNKLINAIAEYQNRERRYGRL